MGKWKSICFGRYFSSLRTFFDLSCANCAKQTVFLHFAFCCSIVRLLFVYCSSIVRLLFVYCSFRSPHFYASWREYLKSKKRLPERWLSRNIRHWHEPNKKRSCKRLSQLLLSGLSTWYYHLKLYIPILSLAVIKRLLVTLLHRRHHRITFVRWQN